MGAKTDACDKDRLRRASVEAAARIPGENLPDGSGQTKIQERQTVEHSSHRKSPDSLLLAFFAFATSLMANSTAYCQSPDSAQPDESIEMRQWGEWRGPLRTGEAPLADPPIEWSETRNVRWKSELPGRGHSSPVVWNDAIFLTTATPFGPRLDPVPVTAPGAHDNLDVIQQHRFEIIRINREDGSTVWQKTVHEALPHEGGHRTGSLASASPVTDGTLVFGCFGSYGLHALDFDGNIIWQHFPGKLLSKHAHGEGASPALHDGIIVINCDHEGQSFVRALATDTGKVLWQRERDEVTSWASPTIVEHPDGAEVVVAGTDRIRAYNLKTGDVVWECGGLSANVVATPVAARGLLIAASSYDTRAMIAIDVAEAHGDITGTRNVVWSTTLRTPYVPSPLIVEDSVYFLRHYQAILSRRRIQTGEETAGPFRLPGVRNIYASPVAAAGRIYIVDLSGRTLVFEHSEQPRPLAVNTLDDSFAATPALVGRQLFLRGQKWLYCIEE
jgi:outer membrane protein assembly factor BamB